MPRQIPDDRLKELLHAATAVFIAQGYRRTQMADVARAMGVAKGTPYGYVESKEALFAACLRYADAEAPSASALDLPLPSPRPGELIAELRQATASEVIPPALQRALSRRRVTDVAAELEGVIRELFALSSRRRTVIKLIDRCGRDHPELAATFYVEGRFAQLDQIARYLEARIRAGKLRAVPDVKAAARFVIESIALWAVHLHWDPAPQPLAPGDAEEIVVHFLLAGLLP